MHNVDRLHLMQNCFKKSDSFIDMIKDELIIRDAKSIDLSAIVNIYNQAIRSGNATGDMEEFSVQQRLDWFSKFTPHKHPIYVAVDKHTDSVLGCVYLSPYRSGRKAMDTVAEISYYVDYRYHSRGIATALMRYAINQCKHLHIENLLAILLEVNTASISLLEKFDFEQWGYYPNIVKLKNQRCSHLVYGLKVS